MNPSQPFLWHSYDLSGWLDAAHGPKWAEEIVTLAKSAMKRTPIVPRSTTSREGDRDSVIQAAVVDGLRIKESLPWLYRHYRAEFAQLAARASGSRVMCAVNDLYGVNLNIQTGREMRYECHVDSNPVQGMLYVTPHDSISGGELIVANNERANSVKAVLEDAAVIQPKRGLLVFFDARKHSHFVSSLTQDDGVRVAVAMNFYTTACPESKRPADLSRHLGLA